MTKTLLIGLDGATFDVLLPLCEQGVMPFLREFIGRGVSAKLSSVIPSLTPPAWTSLVTGRSPGNHGIFDFVRVTRNAAYMQYQMATSTDIQCETLWSIVSRFGKQVATLNFPVMFPPRPVAGYSIPGYVPWRHLRRAVYPPDFYDTLTKLPGFSPKDLVLDLEQERRAIQILEKDEYEEWIAFHIERENKWLEIVRFLMATAGCDLLAVLFDGVDKLQHICWRFIDPKTDRGSFSAWENRIAGLCRSYFERLDAIMAEIVDLAGPDSRVLIASDHGFGPTVELFYVNVWLAEHGYLEWAPGVPCDTEGKVAMLESTRSPAALLNWSKTTACALTSGGNGIYINVAAEPGQPGVQPEDYESFREDLRRKILDFRDPEDGQPVVTSAFTREEVFRGQAMKRAPDLTLQLRDSGFVSILNSDRPLKRRREILGTHRRDGVFMAAGPGIRGNTLAPPMSILDVAPAVLYSMGLPIPCDFEAPLREDLFEPELLRGAIPQSGPATLAPQWGLPQPDEATLEIGAEIHVMNRLKALGYL